MTWLSKLFGGDKAAEKPANADPASLPEPMRMSLDERMALRREMAFKAVKETMIAQGFLSTGYKVNVVRTDNRGHVYAIMIDIGSLNEAGRSLQSQEEMLQIEAQMMEIAKTRYRIKVSSVFWRVMQPSRSPQQAQAGSRHAAHGASSHASPDADAMTGDFVSSPSSPVPTHRAVGNNPRMATPVAAPIPAPVSSDAEGHDPDPDGSLLGALFNSKPAKSRDGFPDTVVEEETVRMERVTEDEMEAFAQALAAAHAKTPVHVGSRTYQTDYAPLE